MWLQIIVSDVYQLLPVAEAEKKGEGKKRKRKGRTGNQCGAMRKQMEEREVDEAKKKNMKRHDESKSE